MSNTKARLARLSALVALIVNVGITAGAADRSKTRRANPRVNRPVPSRQKTSTFDRSAAERRVPATNWCDRVRGGPHGRRDVRVDLSAAVSTTREFSVASAFFPSDDALVAAMGGTAPLNPRTIQQTLDTYASALDDVCAVEARRGELGPATVQRFGSIAFVTPGLGQPTIPRGTSAVVIDLRDLPAVAGLDAALARAVAPALATPVTLPARWVRAHNGPADEFYGTPTDIYSTFVTLDEQRPIATSGSRDLPLVLLTGGDMAPASAAFAGALRLTRRAWIVGADVFSSVAEADWRGVADRGLAIRTRFFDQLSRPEPPQLLTKQTATQDDPDDPSTAGYRRTLQVGADTHVVNVSVDGGDDVDLDLYLLRDADGDGVFTFPDEVVSSSFTPTAHERVHTLAISEPGAYQIWVHGYDVPTGMTTFDLGIDLPVGQLWPDVIPADAPVAHFVSQAIAEDTLRLIRGGPGPVAGAAERSFPEVVDPFRFTPPVTGKPQLRAALLIVHGLTRLFFPYFDVVGDRIDARLIETLESVETWDGSDRRAGGDLLRRFGEALHDGHQFNYDFGPLTYGFLPVFLEEVDGRPVIRRSTLPALHAGDTIVSIDGRRIEDIYAEQYHLTSTASRGYQFVIASDFVSRLYGTTTLELVDPAGIRRSATVEPQSYAVYRTAWEPQVSARPSGPLTDLGAPNLYYINMNGFTSPGAEDISVAIADAVERGAGGIVVDMRGYPYGDIYDTASRLVNDTYLSPQFIVQQRVGPDSVQNVLTQYALGPVGPPAWNGPLVLLTGPHAGSASETFQQMLVGSGRLTAIVGEDSSAGTDGSLTGISLPGGFGFTYTGTKCLNPDGSQFHGIGIVPTVRTTLTAADLRDGIDRDILAAIDVLGGAK